jgi:phosphoribosylaminoimidazole carboxylase (NCAIR synthetase)
LVITSSSWGKLTGSRRLLVLDPVSPDSEDLIATAVRLGHEVFLVSHAGKLPGTVPPGIAENRVVDLSDGKRATAEILNYARTCRIEGVATTREFLTPLMARLCADLFVSGNDVKLADAARNKIVMAERFSRSGVRIPETWVVASEAEAMALIRSGRICFPVVVKPAENAGSTGVSIVASAEDLTSAFDRVRSQVTVYELALDPRVVLQEYVEGNEFSVESVTQDGRTQHVCIVQKITTAGEFRVEIGHSVPARLDRSTSDRILAEASKAVQAVGIRNGLSHTEVKVRPDGSCVTIEIAARIAGGRIGVLVDLALGVNLHEAGIGVALGHPVTITRRCNGCAAVRSFLTPSAGRLVDVRNLPTVGEDVHFVALSRPIGSLVAGPQSNWGRVGQFIVMGTDEVNVNRRADEVLRRIEVLVEPTVMARNP